MSCKSCGSKQNTNVIATCDVCRLNNNDLTAKPVTWCNECNAYICKDHWGNWIARGEAATRNVIKKITKFVRP